MRCSLSFSSPTTVPVVALHFEYRVCSSYLRLISPDAGLPVVLAVLFPGEPVAGGTGGDTGFDERVEPLGTNTSLPHLLQKTVVPFDESATFFGVLQAGQVTVIIAIGTPDDRPRS